MYTQSLLQVILLTGSLAAATPLAKRAGEWQAPDGGRVDVVLHDESINWGSFLPSDAIRSMKEECRGGTACPKEWFLATKIVAESTIGPKENKLYNAQIKIEALDASVQKGEINPLSTIASETFAYTQKMKPLKYWPTPKPSCGSRNPDCDPVRKPERIIDQWYGSKVIVINHRESKKLGSGIVSNLRFQISIVMPEDPTLASGDSICSGLLGAGGAIAGVVNPQLGIPFALASLTCLFAA